MKTALKLAILLEFAVITAYLTDIILSPKEGRASHAASTIEYKNRFSVLSYFSKKLPSYGGYAKNELSSYWIKVSNVIDHTRTSGAVLTVEPSVIENGGQVLVSWKNVPKPDKQRPCYEWIALYCPTDAPSHQYLDYWFVNESHTYTQGYGSTKSTLYNLRVDCEFRYFATSEYTELIAVSNRVQFASGKEAPLHGHLALTGDSSSMRVHWTTGTLTKPVVRYGIHPGNLEYTAIGTSKTYNHSDMCGPPANMSTYFIHPGYLHTVLLTALQPNTKYYYQYGSGNTFSKVKSFMTAVKRGDSTPYSFIIYGDMGLTLGTAKLVKEEVDKGAAFVFHAGDLSYALGFAINWEIWMTLIEPYASLAPYMINIGNHEQDHLVGGAKDPSHAPGEGFHPSWGNFGHDSGGECGVPVSYRFKMPDNGNGVWWYSYEYGMAHFTVFSTEHNFTLGSPQYQWLLNDLKSVDRTVTPWLILIGHRPMYSSEKYPSDYRVTLGMQEALEDMTFDYQVDVALWGHYHAYERTCTVYKQKCNPQGTTHIVIGTAGYRADSNGTYDKPWSVYFEPSHGYGRMTVVNSSVLLWEFVRNRDSVVADSVWIKRRHP